MNDEPIEYELLTSSEVKREYPRLLETFRRLFPEAHEWEFAEAVSIAVGVCGYCHDREAGCHCSNDE